MSNRICSKINDFVFQFLGGLQDSSWQVLLGARRLRAEDDFGGQTLSGSRGVPPQADEGIRWELLPDCRQQQQSSREGERPTFSDFNLCEKFGFRSKLKKYLLMINEQVKLKAVCF